MSTFRKLPVEVEAYQFDNRITNQPPHWIHQAMVAGTIAVQRPPAQLAMFIKTLEGTMTASEGDWIIKGVAGEIYPCKPEIFAVTYEPVSTAAVGSASIHKPYGPAPTASERTGIAGGKAEK